MVSNGLLTNDRRHRISQTIQVIYRMSHKNHELTVKTALDKPKCLIQVKKALIE